MLRWHRCPASMKRCRNASCIATRRSCTSCKQPQAARSSRAQATLANGGRFVHLKLRKELQFMNHFTEARSIPIKDEYDVIVIGGGIAGVSAALAARRSGARVLIVEKGIALGGLATSGLIVFYLCALCDGYGRKIMSGIAEELLHL